MKNQQTLYFNTPYRSLGQVKQSLRDHLNPATDSLEEEMAEYLIIHRDVPQFLFTLSKNGALQIGSSYRLVITMSPRASEKQREEKLTYIMEFLEEQGLGSRVIVDSEIPTGLRAVLK